MQSQHATVSADAVLEDSPTKVAKRDRQDQRRITKKILAVPSEVVSVLVVGCAESFGWKVFSTEMVTR
ncbi:hypothetical protein CMV_008599 [Castanea mollissima]|uniref:Uncharacterized protein n=1 Tax=Castanea mollissima TaxID=60419 RepID=A0A8J4VRY0_9ROSI|nr:hypothetical protein CMV_008599 [Castanea mollissima]